MITETIKRNNRKIKCPFGTMRFLIIPENTEKCIICYPQLKKNDK